MSNPIGIVKKFSEMIRMNASVFLEKNKWISKDNNENVTVSFQKNKI